ncbi:hypothetical protein U1Q18_001214 [Sarracenia purpurea var. burkii]
MPRSCSSMTTSLYDSGDGYNSRSMTPSRHRNDSMYMRGYKGWSPVGFASANELLGEPIDVARSGGNSISMTIRFRPLSEREYQRGDEIAWYADDDKIVRHEYNPATAYAFGTFLGWGADGECGAVGRLMAHPVSMHVTIQMLVGRMLLCPYTFDQALALVSNCILFCTLVWSNLSTAMVPCSYVETTSVMDGFVETISVRKVLLYGVAQFAATELSL